MFLNYDQHIFPGGGEKISRGSFTPPGYGPDLIYKNSEHSKI